MKSLHDIMTDMEATPSPDSWQKLSQRLDVVMPQSPTSSPATPHTAHTAHFAGKAALKMVAAAVGVATVAAGITMAVVTSNKSGSADNQNNTLIVQDTAQHQESATTSTKSSQASNKKTEDEHAVCTDTPTLPVSADNEPNATEGSATIASEKSFKPSSFKPMTIALTPQQQSPIGTITLPSITPIATAAQDDPALQQLDESELETAEPTRLEIPNVFTPNGDGVNDLFVIKGLEQCNIRELIVRNRAGNIVYRNNSYENQWNGDNCDDGVYFYQLTFDSHGIRRVTTGSVTIIRK